MSEKELPQEHINATEVDTQEARYTVTTCYFCGNIACETVNLGENAIEVCEVCVVTVAKLKPVKHVFFL